MSKDRDPILTIACGEFETAIHLKEFTKDKNGLREALMDAFTRAALVAFQSEDWSISAVQSSGFDGPAKDVSTMRVTSKAFRSLRDESDDNEKAEKIAHLLTDRVVSALDRNSILVLFFS